MNTTHNLKHNGAPYNDDATLVHSGDTKSTSGEGRALCTCGLLSGVLATGKARRDWHKEHKLQALDAEVTAEKAEMETIMGQDVLAGTPTDEVADALAELVGDVPAAPRKAKAKAKAKAPTADGATTTVPFKNTVSPHFWFQFGRPAAKALAEKYPELLVGHDDKARTVKLTGTPEQVESAASDLLRTYTEAPETFRSWKTTNEAYKALRHTVADDRRTSYQLTKKFWGDYARQQVLGGAPDA